MSIVSPPMVQNRRPMHSATANGMPSPAATAPATSARAMPIDTAVIAIAVETASPAVARSSTQAVERCFLT